MTLCKTCGKEFKKRKESIFCSKNCFGISRRKRIELKCKFCGKIFYEKVSIASLRKYCSYKCSNEAEKEKNKISIEITRELSYIFGATLGDGCLDTNSISLTSKDLNFVESWINFANRILNKKYIVRIRKDGYFYSVISSIQLVNFFKNRDNLSKVLGKYPEDFIRGFSDAEGCVSFYQSNGYYHNHIVICNSDLPLLKLIQDALRKLDIESKIYGTGIPKDRIIEGRIVKFKKKSYLLRIYKKNSYLNYERQINFMIERKRDKLNESINILQKQELI